MIKALIAGPPCSGKSTWAAEHYPDAEVIDYDTVYAKTSGLPPYDRDLRWDARARETYTWLLREAARVPHKAFVVTASAPRRWQRRQFRQKYGVSRVIVLEVSAEVCMERARRERPGRWTRGVARWWSTYEPDPADVVVRERVVAHDAQRSAQ